jgi:hypothetical protein
VSETSLAAGPLGQFIDRDGVHGHEIFLAVWKEDLEGSGDVDPVLKQAAARGLAVRAEASDSSLIDRAIESEVKGSAANILWLLDAKALAESRPLLDVYVDILGRNDISPRIRGRIIASLLDGVASRHRTRRFSADDILARKVTFRRIAEVPENGSLRTDLDRLVALAESPGICVFVGSTSGVDQKTGGTIDRSCLYRCAGVGVRGVRRSGDCDNTVRLENLK